jgi:hypothetical protein
MLTCEDVTQGVEQFVAAGDSRDVARAEQILHPSFRVVFTPAGGATATLLDRGAWLGLLRDGTIGGDRRKVEVLAKTGEGPLWTVSARFVGAQGTMDSVTTWVAGSTGGCLLLQDATVFTPASK